MGIRALRPEDVEYLAVHCAATKPSQDIGVKDIDRWHRNQGYLKVGYHFVIRRNGQLEQGRPLSERGAHVEGFNHCSVGICLVGGVDEAGKPANNFTPEQLTTLHALLTQLTKAYPQAEVVGHRDFPNVKKACPSFDAKSWWASQHLI